MLYVTNLSKKQVNDGADTPLSHMFRQWMLWRDGRNKMTKFVQQWLLTFIHCRGSEREREREEKELVRNRHPDDEDVKTLTTLLLPSSSSSDVMDLERMDKAVVGARFGGGGAEEHIECKKKQTLKPDLQTQLLSCDCDNCDLWQNKL